MIAEEYAAMAVIIITPLLSYLYGVALRQGNCRFLLASTASMIPISLLFVDPLVSLAIMPIILVALIAGKCGESIMAATVIIGELAMGVIYLETVFGSIPNLLLIVPQIQLGFFYINNIAINVIGVVSESLNSLLFLLMYLITLIPLLKTKERKILAIGLTLTLLINVGTWIDLPTLPLIAPTLPIIKALTSREAGIAIGYLITYLRTATLFLNYLASIALAILVSWRMRRAKLAREDLLLLLMIPMSAAANLAYSLYLSMILFLLLGSVMATLVLSNAIRGDTESRPPLNHWIALIAYIPSFLAFTISIIETINPTLSPYTAALLAFSSPLFGIPTVISLTPLILRI